MFGVSNHDVFRWPGITNGTEKNLLGLFIVTLLLPGIPCLAWGEEQAFYVLESTAADYVFGRSPITSSLAWQLHGCYKVGSVKYANLAFDSSLYGCEDDNISLDHRDPSHPVRNIIKRMFEMREDYPVLNDGYYLQQLSNHTHDIYLPGSNGTATETGIWSVLRSSWAGVQNLTQTGENDQSVWLLYSNENRTVNHEVDCSRNTSLVSPFVEGTTVKNLFAPYEEYTLEEGPFTLGFDGETRPNGCLSHLNMPPWGYKAFVPKKEFQKPRPVLTSFSPGHDYRLWSPVDDGETVHVVFGFSTEMDCDSISQNIRVDSTVSSSKADLALESATCSITDSAVRWVGEAATAFTYEIDLHNVHHGIHQITINNASSSDGDSTHAVDSVLFRLGDFDNPMVYPHTANYSKSLLFNDTDESLYVSHHAAGADLWRYSLDFGTTYGDWTTYSGGNDTLAPRNWSGTSAQAWEGEHVIVQYWARMAGSSAYYQHGDLDWTLSRRFPNIWIDGPFNQYGYDAGLSNQMELGANSTWSIGFMAEWPARVRMNAWGMNPDGQPDRTQVFGDVDGDNILDRLPPQSLVTNMINITEPPRSPSLAYRIELDDSRLHYQLVPVGSRWIQLILYLLLSLVPLLTASGATWTYLHSFYQVKFNEYGVSEKTSFPSAIFRNKHSKFQRLSGEPSTGGLVEQVKGYATQLVPKRFSKRASASLPASMPHSRQLASQVADPITFAGVTVERPPVPGDDTSLSRRTVLIATMEYDIEDWGIKIKIGGLGVMTQLMGKYLDHHDLVWVVPCVGGVDYPAPENGELAEPMEITILGTIYHIRVQTHVLRNITYVLLDAPVFRKQTKAEPYPPRMDDIESAIYYSAWNSCIAQAIRRYRPDIYHINDYHGCIAPLYLLPDTIPCALSLHNAEFQGLWPMRTRKERDEVCKIYNLSPHIVHEYVQFGEVFNLLHAGASYLRAHQNGFGAVGVSTKYGKRAYARYPIFWCLSNVGSLPNPDPSDVAAWSRGDAVTTFDEVTVDAGYESGRGAQREEAQRWANLNVDASAELFVFVGRWSMQKGVDLIADIFPTILEKHPKTQLICVGPVIDLYGKFAALKLAKMMEQYPGRVYSNPKFTALPPCIFTGAEFALIPSRDEPFGLVAVEFGRKGAIGVGARVGGLGQMPGWWYTVESTSTTHLLHQFRGAIESALASKTDVRAVLRARSSRQRFPVAQWVQDLDTLQRRAIKQHQEHAKKRKHGTMVTKDATPLADALGLYLERGEGTSGNAGTPVPTRPSSIHTVPSRVPFGLGAEGAAYPTTSTGTTTPTHSANPTRPGSPDDWNTVQVHDMGTRIGPGHQSPLKLGEPAGDSAFEGLEYIYEDGESVIGRAIGGVDDDLYWQPRPRALPGDTNGIELQDHFRFGHSTPPTPELSMPSTPTLQDSFIAPSNTIPAIRSSPLPASIWQSATAPGAQSEHASFSPAMLSSDVVVGEKKDFNLQKVDPFFTDPEQDYETAFVRQLHDLNGKNTYATTIETFITKSEKDWYNRLRGVKMGKTSTPVGSIFQGKTGHNTPVSALREYNVEDTETNHDQMRRQFLLADDYEPPTGIRKLTLHRLGDWPIYSILLAFGQVIAANSYQITLLTGQVGQTATSLYIIASIYLVTSIVWWSLYRTQKSIWVLSLPFAFFGLAFFLIGMAPLVSGDESRRWIQSVAAGCYATASSSGSLFFALNFGDQGAAPVRSWVFRASVIQGIQQVYISFLWCWGAALARINNVGLTNTSLVVTNPALTTSLGVVIAILMWTVGTTLFFGLPDYYRQTPGFVPGFLSGVFRRKIVLWFFIMVVIQNFFLSAPYGRNWLYLWSSQHLPTWGVALLVILFFVAIWAAMLQYAAVLSKSHSWLMPIFAFGLGAPRWAQMLWGVSGIGQYVPWAGGAIASAVAGRCLWLWLGVLDSLQNVGFGMIMLHTLTRFHISFVLILAQVLGSLATMAARGFSPDRLGPGPVFPNLGFNTMDGLANGWFWVALLAQLLIPVLGLKFFRKEQLSKP
ncbi:hypothetical protein LTR37_016710 [Vermiconidia calcicola]|uniref:Uncharacterized protein n=1 Tax=Vermiconidia calcicola TaxID=1690605 RepID=A0ACC3MM61_9PEZI|nr:hypothetical protein LTR37_016710 [Vermiconidia calcicola]